MKAEFDAFKAFLTGVPVLAGKFYDSVRLQSGSPVKANYGVLSPTVPTLADGRHTGVEDAGSRARHRFDVRLVAVDAAGLLLLFDAVNARLLPPGGVRLVVPGRSCTPVRLVPGVEEGFDFDRESELHFVDMTFEFWSGRAA